MMMMMMMMIIIIIIIVNIKIYTYFEIFSFVFTGCRPTSIFYRNVDGRCLQRSRNRAFVTCDDNGCCCCAAGDDE